MRFLGDQRLVGFYRRNLVTNPVPASTTGWDRYGGLKTGETLAYNSGAGPVGVNGFIRWTAGSGTAAGGVVTLRYTRDAGSTNPFLSKETDRVFFSLYVRSSVARSVQLGAYMYSGYDDVSLEGPSVSAAANTWTRLTMTTPMLFSDAYVIEVSVFFPGTGIAAGATVDMAAAQVEPEPAVAVPAFLYGGSPGARWAGTANASESVVGPWTLTP